jgi:DSF synthase
MSAQAAVALERAATGAISSGVGTERLGKAFEVTIDREAGALWCARTADASPSVTLPQLKEARAIDEKIASGAFGNLLFKVLASRQPGVFSLGGDLALFARCIETNDRAALAEYATLAARAVWANLSAFGRKRVRTIAVVQGETQGGGFEAALSCNTLIAERGTSFGFPEPLFGMFPGMGGELLLRSRMDADLSRRMVQSTNRYTAEFLHEIGVVDYLVEVGTGIVAAENLIEELLARPDGVAAMKTAARQAVLDGIEFSELFASVEAWTERAFRLTARNLRSMRYILEAQNRKLS